MTLEEGISKTLIANGAIASLCAKRVYPDVIPENAQDKFPAIVYQRADSFPDEASYSLDGPGLIKAPIQISCLGKSWSAARSTVDAASAVMAAYLTGGVLVGGFVVDSIHLGNLQDVGFDDASQTFRFDRIIEVIHRS